MTRLETSFVPDGALIAINAIARHHNQVRSGRYILDTGAAMTTLHPALIAELGYGPLDRLKRTNVRSALGEEQGYTVRLDAFEALRIIARDLEVNVFDLGFDDLDGLIGMNFLNHFCFDVRFPEQRILVAPPVR